MIQNLKSATLAAMRSFSPLAVIVFSMRVFILGPALIFFFFNAVGYGLGFAVETRMLAEVKGEAELQQLGLAGAPADSVRVCNFIGPSELSSAPEIALACHSTVRPIADEARDRASFYDNAYLLAVLASLLCLFTMELLKPDWGVVGTWFLRVFYGVPAEPSTPPRPARSGLVPLLEALNSVPGCKVEFCDATTPEMLTTRLQDNRFDRPLIITFSAKLDFAKTLGALMQGFHLESHYNWGLSALFQNDGEMVFKLQTNSIKIGRGEAEAHLVEADALRLAAFVWQATGGQRVG
jgi:hypothetical protein